ncbi:undecaprenyl-phosphate galactose phosphotransferase [Rhizomicrobium palustre]|uniref:Undecaprenyl-phosphate galactose phosphotransferase n=1 Tax=Rhizomicrobium palustre TaxID=189966 RepID=A0A846MUA4_9PROT|nr:undecaprenyl-phosphate galactose phosphotransferase [Rhizomicrobium palustre]
MSNPVDSIQANSEWASPSNRSLLRGGRIWISIAVLATADILAFVFASILFRVGRPVPEVIFLNKFSSQRAVDLLIFLAVIFLIVRYISGDYSRRRLFWESTRVTVLAVLVTSLPFFLVVAAFPNQYSLWAEVGTWASLAVTIPLFRQAGRKLMSMAGLWQLPTILITSPERLHSIGSALRQTLSLGYDVKWLAVEGDKDVAVEDLTGVKRVSISDPVELFAQLAEEGCDQAVVATEDAQSPEIISMMQRLMEFGITVSLSPSVSRLPLVNATTSFFFGRDIFLFQMRSSLQRFPHRVIKRVFDVVMSAVALLMFSPVFAAIAAIIKLRYPGTPVFFGQKVVGRYGQPFLMWKFSTMRKDAHLVLEEVLAKRPDLRREWEETFKLKEDPRVLPGIGDFLRRTSLNELPQLLNVLTGEMSLVGPRPVKNAELIQFYGPAARLYKRVRPGITGLWQVSGRSDTSYDERIVYDEWYILNWSFWYDMVIVLQTVSAVLLRKGAY